MCVARQMPAVLLEASIQEDFNVFLEIVEFVIVGTIFLFTLVSFHFNNWQKIASVSFHLLRQGCGSLIAVILRLNCRHIFLDDP